MAIGVIASIGEAIELKSTDSQHKRARETDSFGSLLLHAKSLGIVYFQDADELNFAPLQSTDPWRRLGEARGIVRLPAHGLVRLGRSQASLADLSPLEDLAPATPFNRRIFTNGEGRGPPPRRTSHRLEGDQPRRQLYHRRGPRAAGGPETTPKHFPGDSLIGDDGIRHIAGLPSIRGLYFYRGGSPTVRSDDRENEKLWSASTLE